MEDTIYTSEKSLLDISADIFPHFVWKGLYDQVISFAILSDPLGMCMSLKAHGMGRRFGALFEPKAMTDR
jgi:hypothetical protein